MNRTTSTLLSLGVSAILIAAGILFLYGCNTEIWTENGRRWAMGFHGLMGGGGMGVVVIIFWTVLITAFILLISGAVTGILSSKQNVDDTQNALEILKARYAHSEIDKTEYDNRRRDIAD
jgi:uncharacterized membrane protein